MLTQNTSFLQLESVGSLFQLFQLFNSIGIALFCSLAVPFECFVLVAPNSNTAIVEKPIWYCASAQSNFLNFQQW